MASVTPGYWHCPRCSSKDLYRAPRQVGTVGFGRGLDGPDANSDLEAMSFAQKSLEKEVLLCRSCGERAVYIRPVKHLTKEEQKRSNNALSAFMYVVSLFFIVVGIAQINSVADTGPSVPGFAWLSIVAGIVSGGFGFLVNKK